MRQLGPYFLSRRIGAGGMAEVWMGHRATLGASKTVAVKLLAPSLTSKPEYRRMFLEEARLAVPLNNSGIVQVFEAGEIDGECYMVMEWVDGVNLAELHGALWQAGEQLSVEISMYILGEVLRALDYAHNFCSEGAATIVHRDISPQNIMLSVAGEVKIMDFGVARFATEETTGLHVKGKLRYMPPEQLQGSSKGTAVDMFAVGAVLHEMLDGQKFRSSASDDPQLLGMIFACQTPSLSQAWRIPPELEFLRYNMLLPNPHERLGSARAALRSLALCPGYRNASLELAELVRACQAKKVMEARSTGTGLEWSRTGNVVQPFTELMPEAQMSETSVSRRTMLAPVNPGTAADLQRRSGPRKRRRSRVLAALLVGAGGIFIGMLGIGYAINMMLAETAGEVIAHHGAMSGVRELLPSVKPQLEGIGGTAAEWATKPTKASIPSERPEPSAAPVVAPVVAERPTEPPEQPRVEKGPAEPKPVAASPERVEVEFVAGDFVFLYLKVKGKTVTLEPTGTMKLPPGKTKLQIRQSTNEEWRSIYITVPNRRCRVELSKKSKRPKIVPLG